MANDTYTVQRTTTVDAPPARVYEQVVDFHNWTRWSPWEDTDPQLQRTYSGAAAGAGAVYAWSGNRKAGRGRMEITSATEPSNVTIDLAFDKPMKAQNVTVFTVEPEGTGSRVTWSMTGKRTLLTKALGVVVSMDRLLGPDFEKGLRRLKVVAESPGG